MSLTTQLYDGYLASWCAKRLPGTPGVVDQVQAAVREAGRPVRPARQVEREHWAEVGGIVDARLSSFVQLAAPYGALLGAVRVGALARGTAELEATAWPSHAGTPDVLSGLAVRPSPTGWIRLPAGGPDQPAPDPVEMLLGGFLDRLTQFHDEHAPAGRLGAVGVERQLARANWVLSQLEGAYRGTPADPRLVRALTAPGTGVEHLLQLAPEPQVVEVVEILQRADQAGALAQLRELAGKPRSGALGYAGPVFLDRWADGDLILTAPPATGLGRLTRRMTGAETGPASTLLDVKTVMTVTDAERVARWLWQIAGYAALDERDLWRIRRAGLFLARHGVLITWPIDELFAQLADVDTGEAPAIRRAFTDAVVQAARSEGATGFPVLV